MTKRWTISGLASVLHSVSQVTDPSKQTTTHQFFSVFSDTGKLTKSPKKQKVLIIPIFWLCLTIRRILIYRTAYKLILIPSYIIQAI